MNTTTEYTATATVVTIHQNGKNPCFEDQILRLQLEDEGGGPFFLLSQDGGTPLRVELAELKLLAAVAKELLAQPGVEKLEAEP